jgi:uncharacterized repeat protein (TIGR01451 family)
MTRLRVLGSLLALACAASALAAGPDLTVRVTPYLPAVTTRSSVLRVAVENLGDAPAKDVTLTLTVEGDAGISWLSFELRPTSHPRTYVLHLDEIAPGRLESQEVVLSPNAEGGRVTVTLTATSSTPDANPHNDSLVTTFDIARVAALSLRVEPPVEIDADGLLPYTIVLTNRSPVDATGVKVVSQVATDVVDVPAGATIKVTHRAPGTMTHLNVTATWDDPALQLSAAGAADVVPYRKLAVTTAADAGPGSLRAAIETANAECDEDHPCRIAFDGGPFTITPRSALPPLQAAATLFDGAGRVELRGDGLPANGLTIAGINITVRGVTVNSFGGNGISVQQEGTAIRDSFIGTDPTGTIALPNERGVRIGGSWNTLLERNVISGNRYSGVFLDGRMLAAYDNRIGVSPTGSPLGNGASGVFAADHTTAFLGGNTIAFNHDVGIGTGSGVFLDAVENSIHDNGRLGIDVGLDGQDAGRPVITSVRYDAASGQTIITATADATPTPTAYFEYRALAFYANGFDPSGPAEGNSLLGRAIVDPLTQTAEFHIHADLRGWIITALAEHMIDWADYRVYTTGELSDGAPVPRR